MNNLELIKTMTVEEVAEYLYVHISKKGLKKTKQWLLEESNKTK